MQMRLSFPMLLLAVFLCSGFAEAFPERASVDGVSRRQDGAVCDFSACAAPTARVASWIYVSSTANLGDNLNSVGQAAALSGFCGDLQEAGQCIEDSLSADGCLDSLNVTLTDGQNVTLHILNGLLSFICSPFGQRALVSEAPCWNNENLESRMRQDCSPPEIDEGNYNAVPGETMSEQGCTAMEQALNCTVNTVWEVCHSVRAAFFMGGVMYSILSPIAQYGQCYTE